MKRVHTIRTIIAAAIFLLTAVACNLPSSSLPAGSTPSVSPMPASPPVSTSLPSAETPSTPTAAPSPYPQPDLSHRPLIFFGPLPKPEGSLDFMDLFAEDAPWTKAAQHIQVFNLYGGWVAHFPWEPDTDATDAELKRIILDLNRRGIAIGFEASPLVAPPDCGQGVEGFFGPEEGLQIVNRLKQLGADVRYVSLDEPYAFGHIYDGPSACRWPAEKIALQVKQYIDVIKSVYPQAIVGDNEPLWSGVDIQELITWLDAYKAATGSSLPFIHLDLDFSRPDWPEQAKKLEDAARARGVEFGMFYFGDPGDASDAAWLDKAFERARIYELMTGGRPDHVKFQSWHDRPDYLLPETRPDTFTALIDRYFRTRTELSLEAGAQNPDGSIRFTGALQDNSGTAVKDGVIELSIRALDGPGLVAEYTITGTVPENALRSDVGFRVNTECGCQGQSDFVLYQARYTEGEASANLVPNGSFEHGLDLWGSWGSGLVRLEPSDQGSGSMLHVQAAPDQDAAINSSPFTVTPGSRYRLTFVARVTPASLGSGYFDITFQDQETELSRQTINLEAGLVNLGSAVTGDQGEYTLQSSSLPIGRLLIEANYAGSDLYWPAYARIELLPR